MSEGPEAVLTAAQMRAIEAAAIDSGAVTGLELMERAGQGVVNAIFEEWPDLAPGVAVVLCGPGNNGGDGFVVARLLRDRGWEVEVYLYGDAGKLPRDARANYDRWAEMGGNVGNTHDLSMRLDLPFDADDPWMDLFIDAGFGTGLTRPLPAEIVKIANALNDREEHERGWIVAIDLPSGICSDSGRVIGNDPDAAVMSDLTVTFHRAKLGHILSEGPGCCGKVVVKDIGLDGLVSQAEGSDRPGVGARRPPGGAVGRCPAVPGVVHLVEGPGRRLEKHAGHKFSHGHALILSGGSGRTGAARLAARGALRIGAGLVTLGVPGSAQLEVAAQVTAVMLRRVEDGAALAEVMQDKRINALCLGPGLGVGRAAGLVRAALLGRGAAAESHSGGAPTELPSGGAPSPTPPPEGEGRRDPERCGPARWALVLDADALTAIAPDAALFGALHERCVLTPHGGEFARLFPDLAERLAAAPSRGPAYSKVDATRDAAARCGAVVLFKGADTVIAGPDGQCAVNAALYERTAPWLATAGAGDVLAGFITGLLARGCPPLQAAKTAAWLHVECARAFGPGLIAEDLPEVLPRVLAGLVAKS